MKKGRKTASFFHLKIHFKILTLNFHGGLAQKVYPALRDHTAEFFFLVILKSSKMKVKLQKSLRLL